MVLEAMFPLPGEEEACVEIRTAIGAWSPGIEPNPWDSVTPLVREVARIIGTHALKTDEKGEAFTRFRKLYRDRRAKFIGDLQSGAVALPVGGEIVQLPRRGVA